MAVTGFIGGKPTFLNMIQGAGASANLDFCLDAAAGASYDGTSQTWVDLTGNGNSFFRGATSGSEASDPTFSGTANKRSSAEKFTFDTGDFFRETAGHTFAESWHKENGVATILGVATRPSGGTNFIPFANSGGLSPGVVFQLSASGSNIALVLLVVGELIQTSVFGPGLFDAPVFFAVAWDAAVGTDGITFQINGTRQTGPSTYGAPIGTSNSSVPYQIGAADAITSANGSEAFCLAAWTRRLSNTELDAIYAKLKKRYTTLP